MKEESKSSYNGPTNVGIILGVWWYVWGVKGFWWGVLYGLFWKIWLGYRLAEYLFGK